MKKKFLERICAVLLIISMLIPSIPVDAMADDTDESQTATEETITIVAGTDFQGRETDDPSEAWDNDTAINKLFATISDIMTQIKPARGETIDGFFFLGDYASQPYPDDTYSESKAGLKKLRDYFSTNCALSD